MSYLAGECLCLPATEANKKRNCLAISPALYAEGATRGNANVTAWGAWCALDIDDGAITTDVAIDVVEGLGLNYCIYGSTKHSPAAHRYRVLLETSREFGHGWGDDIQKLWFAITQRFADLGADGQCKDISRIYSAPMRWTPAADGNTDPLFTFECKIDGVPLDLDEVLAAYVPPVVVTPPHVVAAQARAALKPSQAAQATTSGSSAPARARPTKIKALPAGGTLFNSPVVHSQAVNTYLSLPKGAHHGGLYTFMASVAGRAKSQGYGVTADDLVDFARQLDDLSPVKTSRQRWITIHKEADKALDFVAARD